MQLVLQEIASVVDVLVIIYKTLNQTALSGNTNILQHHPGDVTNINNLPQ